MEKSGEAGEEKTAADSKPEGSNGKVEDAEVKGEWKTLQLSSILCLVNSTFFFFLFFMWMFHYTDFCIDVFASAEDKNEDKPEKMDTTPAPDKKGKNRLQCFLEVG